VLDKSRARCCDPSDSEPQALANCTGTVNQPKVSALADYPLDGFSVELLMNILTAWDRDVHIVIRTKAKSQLAASWSQRISDRSAARQAWHSAEAFLFGRIRHSLVRTL
jgi:hypothetical protein